MADTKKVIDARALRNKLVTKSNIPIENEPVKFAKNDMRGYFS